MTKLRKTLHQDPGSLFPKTYSYLVRAKLYPLQRTVGSRKCSNKKRGEACENVQNSDIF